MYVELARYDYITEAYIAVTALESANFNCFIQNFEHGSVNPMALIAFGGMRVMILENEFDDAASWLRLLRETAQPNSDENLNYSKRGMWVRGTAMALFSPQASNPFLLLFVFLSPNILLAIWLGLIGIFAISEFPYSANPDNAATALFMIYFGLVIWIVHHARYIALPRIRKTQL